MLCGVHMFHAVNGRQGFDALPKPLLSIPIPTFEVVLKMLQREDELRLSAKYQDLFADPGHNAIHIAALAQKQVAEEFGYSGDQMDQIVDVLRAAISFFPEKQTEICRVPHYLKFNRSKKGTFDIGSSIIDVPLVTICGRDTTLFKYLNEIRNKERPILIASGSYS